jgi:YHS domain-containing protein
LGCPLLCARKTFRAPWIYHFDHTFMQADIRDVEDISFLISEIEKDGKGVPVLLKHYLKLSGKLLSFNVDKDFSGVVDGLLYVDLRETDPKILNRFIRTKNPSSLFSGNLPEDDTDDVLVNLGDGNTDGTIDLNMYRGMKESWPPGTLSHNELGEESNMKTIISIVSLTLLVMGGPVYAQAGRPADIYNLDKAGLGIKGYDPVSYHLGKPQKGQKSLSFQYKGVPYLFATEENRAVYKSNPSAYEPAYGGWCAWAMLEGDKIDFNPKRYKIINGKTYLFYDGFFGNTLKKWNRFSKKESEADMIKRADEHWQRIISEHQAPKSIGETS